MTSEEKAQKQAENKKLYGLSDEFVTNLKTPAKTSVQIFSVSKVVNAKVRLSTVEKINHLLELQKALDEKLIKLKEQKEKKQLQR